MSLAGWTEFYYLISCTLSRSFFLSCFSDILMLDWDICCGVLHSSLLVAWLCCCCCLLLLRRQLLAQPSLSKLSSVAAHACCVSLTLYKSAHVSGPKSGYSRTVQLQPAGTDVARPHVATLYFPFTSPCASPSSSASHSSHLFPSRSLQPALGLETNVFRLCQLPLWTVNSGPLLLPPFSYFLFLPPWCLHPPSMETLPFSLSLLYLRFWALA